jgi:gliding motility-associated-like protein
LSLGPDNKIYCLFNKYFYDKVYTSSFDSIETDLSVINFPDSDVASSGYVEDYLKICTYGGKAMQSFMFPILPNTYNYSTYSKADFSFSIDTCSRTVSFSDSSKYTNHFLWDFGDGHTSSEQNPYHTFSGLGSYNVSLAAWNDSSCADTVHQIVDIKAWNALAHIKTYNVFTPNNDNYNDEFRIGGLDCGVFSMLIYNCWGQLLYRQDDTSDLHWNGKINGRPADAGTYYFTILQYNKEIRSGAVDLIR